MSRTLQVIKQRVSSIGGLRSLKLVHIMSNLLNRGQLQHLPALYKQHGIDKKWWQLVSSKDFEGLDQPTPWLDREDADVQLQQALPESPFTEATQARLKDWPEKGYVVLPGFFNHEQVSGVMAELEQLKADGTLAPYTQTDKIMDAWRESPKLRAMMTDPQLLEIMGFLLGRDVNLFQTINFEYGSQYDAHSDTVHMTTFPLGFLTAIWVAMEDIQPDSGPLYYFPGSHKLPYVLNPDYGYQDSFFKVDSQAIPKFNAHISKMVEAHGLKPEVFLPKKGDLVIWHANLLHGGAARENDQQTRKCTVGHYFANDVICYHEHSQRPALIAQG